MERDLGKPLFEMCWFFMGIAQIVLDSPPPLSNGQTWNKKYPKPSWQALTPQANVGKKCPKPSWQALTPPGNVGKKCPKPSWQAWPPPLTCFVHMETHFPYSVLTTIGPTRFSPTHPFCCTNLNRKFVEIYPKVIFICLTLKSNLQLGAGVWMEWIEKVLGLEKMDWCIGGRRI